MLNKPVPVDLWIDGAGQLRKATLIADAGGEAGTLDVTIQLDQLNEPVSVSAPPASEVTRLQDLAFFKGLFGPN